MTTAPPHCFIATRQLVESHNWEPLAHPAYSSDPAPSKYHLFGSRGNVLNDLRFDSHAEAKKWIDSWFAAKDNPFFWKAFLNCLKDREIMWLAKAQYFEI
uniref:Putative LOC100903547 [Metaseiulus occidentalis] n=1 Tax=Lepeophtheirus salmonis TaxID=72036 RepID=A0A0K2UWE5_LEPSM